MIALIPEFLDRPNVLGIGEIGLNKNSRNELTILEEQIELRRRARSAHPRPHAAPRGQAQGHAADHRRDPEQRRHRSRPRAHRPRRGAHRRDRARRGLLGGHDALPGHEVHAAARGGHHRDVRHGAASGSTPPATGGRAIRSRFPRRGWRWPRAGTPAEAIDRISFDNPRRVPEPERQVRRRCVTSSAPGTSRSGYCTNVHAGDDARGDPGEPRARTRSPCEDGCRRTHRSASGCGSPHRRGRALRAPGRRGATRASGSTERGLHVFTINGFPYGDFHERRREARRLPAGLDAAERLEYTIDLCTSWRSSCRPGGEGSISTLPIGWRGDEIARGARPCRRGASAHVAREWPRGSRRRRGALLHVDLEPEPGCALERQRDVVGVLPAAPAHRRGGRDACSGVTWASATTSATRRSCSRTSGDASIATTRRAFASARCRSRRRCASRSTGSTAAAARRGAGAARDVRRGALPAPDDDPTGAAVS